VITARRHGIHGRRVGNCMESFQIGRKREITTHSWPPMKIKGNSLPQKSSQSPRNNYKLFQSSNLSVNPRPLCSLAQKGNYLTVALVSVSPNSSHPWIIDSGATDHMT